LQALAGLLQHAFILFYCAWTQPCNKFMLNHCLEWYKWVLTNFDHDRLWFNTLIPPSHESAAVTVDRISRLRGQVRLILRYTTPDIHCRDRRYEWDGGLKQNKINVLFYFITAFILFYFIVHDTTLFSAEEIAQFAYTEWAAKICTVMHCLLCAYFRHFCLFLFIVGLGVLHNV